MRAQRVPAGRRQPRHARNAAILLALVIVGTYFAVTKELPFTPKYEVKAVFENAANIRGGSPVRIAGVNVGEVSSVRSLGDAAEVTFTVDEAGRPIHEDATAEIRPRIFLEGNFFVDVHPGSPSASELDEGETIPITQTGTAVQLDQVLTALQTADRENLQKLLRGYGTALNYRPRPADDIGQDPDVQGETAGEAINDSFQYGADAGRDSAIANEALLGTEPHDLSGLIAGNARVFGALLQREQQLQDLITNFNTFSGALASESDELAESVRLLAPTLERATPALRNTNEVFPYLRAFAREIEPGVRELPGTIDAAGPWLAQARRLLADRELGGIARQLRKLGKPAAQTAVAGPGFFSETELLGRCVSDVLIPTGDVVLDDSGPGFDFSTGVPNYKEFAYALAGFASESQTFDGNGPYLRFQTGGGPQLTRMPLPNGGFENEFVYGNAIEAPIGVRPLLGPKPPFRTDVACHTNPIPNLNGPAAAIGPPSPQAVP